MFFFFTVTFLYQVSIFNVIAFLFFVVNFFGGGGVNGIGSKMRECRFERWNARFFDSNHPSFFPPRSTFTDSCPIPRVFFSYLHTGKTRF